MIVSNTQSRIRKLSNLVANQIAAGEVVERPAAVLKELLENSIDAGAQSIEISATNGGINLIKVQDDGIGIVKEDLALAFAQHATSKISAITDLEAITSLGFRGEAIASIAAVSRLEIISKPATQAYAYKAAINADDCSIEPYSHPNGTSVIMQDLYYNIPARKKFLRSERSEFLHLDDVFKRIALSNFGVDFKFKHNQKSIYLLKACIDINMQGKRVAELCGNYFMQHSSYITVEQNGIHLCGWLGLPGYTKTYADCQYFFINNRLVKDRLVVNVLRKAYKEYLDNNSKHPMYCLYLTIAPDAVDINVHPNKAEVRFREANLVFFFLVNAISQILKECQVSNSSALKANLVKSSTKEHPEKWDISSFIPKDAILSILDNKIILLQKDTSIQFISIKKLRYNLNLLILQKDFRTNSCITMQKFIVPKKIIAKDIAAKIVLFKDLLLKLGIDCDSFAADTIVIRSYPQGLELAVDLEGLLSGIITALAKTDCLEQLFPIMAKIISNNELCSNVQAEWLLQQISIFDEQATQQYQVDLTAEKLHSLLF
jgi:DNA mismatch repair protein MutL